MKTLVLNSDYRAFDIISWKSAITKALCGDTIYTVEIFDKQIRDGRGNLYDVPAVIALKQYVDIHNEWAGFSKRNIHARDEYICQYCGKEVAHNKLTVDHVVPKETCKRKGIRANTFENVVTCCERCNAFKGNKTPEQADMELLRTPTKITKGQLFIKKYMLQHLIPKEWLPYIKHLIKDKNDKE